MREIAFVTGGAQGIGLAIVRRLAEDGFHVVAMDRTADRLAAAVEGLGQAGLDVTAAPVDVCDREAVSAVFSPRPRVDVVVCAAGIYNDAAFLDLTDDAFRRMFKVNVVGTFIPAQEGARRMQAGGRIVTSRRAARWAGRALPTTWPRRPPWSASPAPWPWNFAPRGSPSIPSRRASPTRP